MRGMRKRIITLDLDLLENIKKELDIPLVLHGASGVKWDSIKKAIKHGICKVNIASTFDKCFVNTARNEMLKNPDEINFRKILKPARDAVKDKACEIFDKLGSSNQY